MLNLNGVVVVEHAQMIEEEEVGGLRGCWRARGLHGWLCRVAGTEDTWCGSVASMCSLGAAGMAASTPWLLGSSFRWGVPPATFPG